MHTVAELKALIKKYKEQGCPPISKMKKADMLKFAQEKGLLSESHKVAEKPAEKPVEKPAEKVAKKPGRKPKLFGEGMQKLLEGKPLVDPELVNEYEKYEFMPKNYKSMSMDELDAWEAKTELFEKRKKEIEIYKRTGKTAAEQRKKSKELEEKRKRESEEATRKHNAEWEKHVKDVKSGKKKVKSLSEEALQKLLKEVSIHQ